MIENLQNMMRLQAVEPNLFANVFLLITAIVFYVVANRIILPVIYFLIIRSPTKLDNKLIEKKVLKPLSMIPSFYLLYTYSEYFLTFSEAVNRFSLSIIVFCVTVALNRFLLVLLDIYNIATRSRGKSIKGFVEIIIIILYIFSCIIILSILIDSNPTVFLSGLGAMSAIIMLIFKDTILSFVASMRIVSSGIIEIGDWLEIPKYNADGDVIDIALHTIQIQNWDKTITTIPTHKIIDESFKNWRGIKLAGGRRIMRDILIDVNTIKFCDDKMIEKFSHIHYLKDYITRKNEELKKYNLEHRIDNSVLVNGRRMTNIGIFRAYIKNYLLNHPKVNHDLTMLIRQMPPDSHGLPLQIYVFTKDIEWGKHEDVQSDIFDHLFAVVPEFDLRVYQNPTGTDLKEAYRTIVKS